MTDAGTSWPAPVPGRRALRWLVFGTLFVAAGFLGRATIIDDRALSLVWPAAGVAALWVGSSPDRRGRALDVAGVALATFTVNGVTGAAPTLALVFVVTNVVQVLVVVTLVRRWLPDLWGFGGAAALFGLRSLGLLTGAAVLACLLGALIGVLGLVAVLGTGDLASFLVWWGRNAVAMVVIVTAALLAARPLAAAGSPRRALQLVRRALVPPTRSRGVEGLVLVAVSVGLYVVLFSSPAAGPLAFLILVTSVWAGIRFSPLTVALHGIAMGATGIVFTLNGIGPFATIDSLHYRALVAQVFVAMAVLKGLALAFSRAERDRAIVELAEARHVASERAGLLDAVLESMTEGMVVIEEDGTVLVRNSAGRRLLGMDPAAPDHIEPAASYGLFRANGLPVEEAELPGLRALEGETVLGEDYHVRADSVPGGRVVEISAHPLTSDDPATPRRAMVTVRDVTLDRQHRDSLASFAGVVAHDLFNPLSVVDGWTEALAEEFGQGPVSPAVGSLMVSRISRAATHMREFIADLMSYTIARDQSLRQGPVDLTAMVRSLAALRTEGPSSPVVVVAEELQVWADSGLTRQLLDNLIGNAVKYVEAGTRPVVEVTGEPDGDWLEVRVADNGIGIPEHQREAVFETFHQVNGPEYGGTGLGLAICRRIVDRHGGTIHIAPGRRGSGCTVVFRLPLAAPAPAVPAQQAALA